MEIIYVVKIKIGYHDACFGFTNINEAAHFMMLAAENKTAGDDDAEIVMEAREKTNDK